MLRTWSLRSYALACTVSCLVLAACPDDSNQRVDVADGVELDTRDEADADAVTTETSGPDTLIEDTATPDDTASDTATPDDVADTADTVSADTVAPACDPPDCDDQSACTEDRCDSGACVHTPLGAEAVTIDWGNLPPDGGVAAGPFTPEVAVDGPANTVRVLVDGEPLEATTVLAQEGHHYVLRVDVVACDDATFSASRTFRVDLDAPTITYTVDPPPNAAGWHHTPVTVTFVAGDTGSATTVTAPMIVAEQGADVVVTGQASDQVGHTASVEVHLAIDLKPPTVTLTDPIPNNPDDDQLVTAAESVTVSGELGDDALSGFRGGLVTSTKSALRPTFDAPGAYEATFPLRPGVNTLTVSASDVAGNAGTASICVIRDVEPPLVHIQSPADGATVDSASVTVVGLAQDLVVGWITEEDVAVTLNGEPTAVDGGRFAQVVPLSPGATTITAVATDAVGFQRTHSITVHRVAPAQRHLEIVSGDGQAGVVTTTLAAPLVVRLVDGDGQPVAGERVTFAVAEGDGELVEATDGGATILGPQHRTSARQTDDDGLAAIGWRLGARAGRGVDRVSANAGGALAVVGCAFTSPDLASRVVIHEGDNQIGATAEPLPMPLSVRVTDDHGNPADNVPVAFSVIRGDGGFASGASALVTSNANGFADAVFTPGTLSGYGEHEVVASIFGAQLGEPGATRFSVSAFPAGDDNATIVDGLVVDEAELAIPGIRVELEIDGEPTRTTVTDAAGRFAFVAAPPGFVRLRIDGPSAVPQGATWTYPVMTYEMRPMAGVTNSLDRPVYLLKVAGGKYVDGHSDVELTVPELPGFSLKIPAGTAITFPDGSHEGVVSVTPVSFEQAPMSPLDGLQPRLLVTIQPANVRFDPPAPLAIPNIDGLAPGRKVDMVSFDHDLETFVGIGVGTVSEDGTRVVSDPGVGVVKGGWHAAPFGPPDADCSNITCTVSADGSSATGTGSPGPDTRWSHEVRGGLTVTESDCPDDSTSCRLDLEATNGASAYGCVKMTHSSTVTGASASDTAAVKVCDTPPVTTAIEWNPVGPIFSKLIELSESAVQGLGACTFSNPTSAIKDKIQFTYTNTTECCPECPASDSFRTSIAGGGELAFEAICQLFPPPNPALRLAPVRGGLQVAFKASLDVNVAYESTTCCPDPPCRAWTLNFVPYFHLMLRLALELGPPLEDAVVLRVFAEAGAGVTIPVAYDFDKLCVKGCVDPFIFRVRAETILGGVFTFDWKPFCPIELGSGCWDLDIGDPPDGAALCHAPDPCAPFYPPDTQPDPPAGDPASILSNSCSTDPGCGESPIARCYGDFECDDGDPCNGVEFCEPPVGCIKRPPPDCDDQLSCTYDRCVENVGCVHDERDDQCSHLNNECARGHCNQYRPAPGDGCYQDLTDFQACDDGVMCTRDECTPDGCEHRPTDFDCVDDDVSCTDAHCRPEDPNTDAVGCVHEPVDTKCTDPWDCTVDRCDSASPDADNEGCVYASHDELCEDDGATCTAERCDPLTGCEHEPVHAVCDDHASCTEDACSPSLGTSDPVTGCWNNPDDSLCDDGQECTAFDACDPQASDSPDGCFYSPDDGACDDEVACTQDSCAPFTGCDHLPDHGACDDGRTCTIDTCTASGCDNANSGATGCDEGGCAEDSNCDDLDPCTKNVCVEHAYCDYPPLCPAGETCNAGVCSGGNP